MTIGVDTLRQRMTILIGKDKQKEHHRTTLAHHMTAPQEMVSKPAPLETCNFTCSLYYAVPLYCYVKPSETNPMCMYCFFDLPGPSCMKGG